MAEGTQRSAVTEAHGRPEIPGEPAIAAEPDKGSLRDPAPGRGGGTNFLGEAASA